MINLLVIFAVILFDQLSKFLAPKVGLTVVENTGIAFGLFPNFAWGLIVFLLLLGFLLNSFKKSKNQFSVGLIFGGGISNLFDRLYFGHIRDFIDLKFWPVFNLADAAICLGVGLLLFKQKQTDKKKI